MGTVVDLTGARFGRLVVMGRGENTAAKKATWLCRCDCGATVRAISNNLRGGSTTSCGCLQRELLAARNQSHGHTAGGISPTYHSWSSMVQRCTNPKRDNYARYGGQGTTVAPEWIESFEAFLAHVGERPAGTTLDRIDPFGNYEPGNVRWATPSEQEANKRSKVGQR